MEMSDYANKSTVTTLKHKKLDDKTTKNRQYGQPSKDALVGDVSAVGRSTLSGRKSVLQSKTPKEVALEVEAKIKGRAKVKVKTKIGPDELDERRGRGP